MPELPEVETTLRGIEPHVVGRQITGVEVRDARLRWPIPPELPALLNRKKLLAIRRRGKYLLLQFSTGHELIHLGMSGSLRLVNKSTAPLMHDHFDLAFGNTVLRYCDPRRFGCLLWLEDEPEHHALLRHLGPEPLSDDFDAEYLYRRSRKRTLPVKQFIMDSKVVVGVGNIYANEALHLARVHPRAPSSSIPQAGVRRLHRGLRRVLRDAIRARGTTLRDYRTAAGAEGSYEGALRVYGRKGRPCPRCGAPVERLVFGNRSAFLCPRCQPETRR
jgi:formamidopyrimidine-DNA glycosylase